MSVNYTAKGMTDQPFAVEVLEARRTLSNTLLVRLALTNRGTAPLRPEHDFSGNSNPADANRISALYVVDPNGRAKYAVLRDAQGQALCSSIVPEIQPGERRVVYAQLLLPPDTSSTVSVIFPKADPILNVPLGLAQAGLPGLPETTTGNPAGAPVPSTPAPLAPAVGIDQPTSNNLPNVYTKQTQLVASGTPLKGIGSVESSNSIVAFTVEVLDLKTTAAGATLRLAFTNNGSGVLDAAGLFTGGASDLANDRQISGVYLVDAASKQRYEVVRASQTNAMCSKIDPAFGPGERRMLEARFPAIAASVKSV